MKNSDIPDAALIEQLRRAASIWFRNDDLLLMEELIRRYARGKTADNAALRKTLIFVREQVDRNAHGRIKALESIDSAIAHMGKTI
jgi:hypothetical protein